MRIATTLIAASVAVLLASSAWADGSQDPSTTTQTAAPAAGAANTAAKPADPQEKLVCVRQEEVGSRIPGKKECHTQRTWDEMSAGAQGAMGNLQQRSDQTSPLKGS